MIIDKRFKSIAATVAITAAFIPGCQSGNSPANETRPKDQSPPAVASETKITGNNGSTPDTQGRVTWRERSKANKTPTVNNTNKTQK